ncbi:FixH family protein [Massilia antarctica]|uniref:FixH family protein n=1 Tax=Massilia antarctica TaxID=2765360 RepID=UPI0006BB9862|nr:FixH family protein [Massilia sp. H27-R4]MCY0910586.1 FixH family protein [Massilia sp. H27-R4]CUI09050.1 Putative analog of CcoH, COG3198 [Janthinobacterium sp. CG23_2]CUU32836.1 Putative analog of CcoH, COG3198 [Janthinobacterium sp. CG23_2]
MQTASPLTPSIGPWYKHRWPWLLMLGPALVVVGGVNLGFVAWRGQDAMVVDDYYKQGKAINQDLRRDRVASAMRLSFNAAYDPATERLAGTLSSGGQALAAPFSIYLAHATQPQKDRKLDVIPDAAGHFSVALPLLERARWQVVVEGGKRDWRLAAAWHWPREQALAIDADAPSVAR